MPNDNGGTDYDRAFLKAIEIMDDDNQKITGYLINKEIELIDDNREAAASLSIKDVEIRDDQKEKAGQLGSKIIIFISDGNSDNDYNCRQETIDECTKKRYKIYPIGICTHQDSKTIFKKMADNTEGLSFFAESGQEFADIFDDLAKMMPYELIGINSKVIKIIPPYFSEIKDLKMIETPYKQIYKNKYDKLENELKTEEDGTKSIFCEIGTLFAYNSKWILSYRAKTAARLPASLILSDSSSKKSVFNYVNEKGNLVEGTLPITEIQFKAEQGLIRKIIDSLAGNKK
jgi:hypothetical protein